MTAIPVSNAVGAPIAGFLLRLHWAGLSGWRWLLILEGIPAFLGGVATIFYLTDRPKDAHWLAPAERDSITGGLDAEVRPKKTTRRHMSGPATLRHPIV